MSDLTKRTPACVESRQTRHVMKPRHNMQKVFAMNTLKALTVAALAVTALAAPAAAPAQGFNDAQRSEIEKIIARS